MSSLTNKYFTFRHPYSTNQKNHRNDYIMIYVVDQLYKKKSDSNMLDLDAGIFDKFPSRSASNKPLSKYMSNLLSIQDNLLKASAKESLRTDLLHLTTKEQNKHREYAIDSYVLVHYRTGSPPTRLHTNWKVQ